MWSVHTFWILNPGESGSGTWRGDVEYSVLREDASSCAVSAEPLGIVPFCSILSAIGFVLAD